MLAPFMRAPHPDRPHASDRVVVVGEADDDMLTVLSVDALEKNIDLIDLEGHGASLILPAGNVLAILLAIGGIALSIGGIWWGAGAGVLLALAVRWGAHLCLAHRGRAMAREDRFAFRRLAALGVVWRTTPSQVRAQGTWNALLS